MRVHEYQAKAILARYGVAVPRGEVAFNAAEAGGLNSVAPHREHEAALTFGREFGFAYQAVDDYIDGEIEDLTLVTRPFAAMRTCLDSFGERAQPLEDLLDHLNAKIWEDGRSHR